MGIYQCLPRVKIGAELGAPFVYVIQDFKRICYDNPRVRVNGQTQVWRVYYGPRKRLRYDILRR